MKGTHSQPIIALLTDFGTTDTYVGSMKASIYGVNPQALVIDLCHSIGPQKILEAAFVLCMVYGDYPAGTIFVAVVDPGVGSERHPLLVETDRYLFIGPNNGIFSYIYQEEQIRRLLVLSNPQYFRPCVSSTFHGRDVFGPAAAWVSKKGILKNMGHPLADPPCTLDLPTPKIEHGDIIGQVMRIDCFGNLLTSIHQRDAMAMVEDGMHIFSHVLFANQFISTAIPVSRYYAERPEGNLIAVWGSSGFLEIAANQGSAKAELHAELGEKIALITKKSDADVSV